MWPRKKHVMHAWLGLAGFLLCVGVLIFCDSQWLGRFGYVLILLGCSAGLWGLTNAIPRAYR